MRRNRSHLRTRGSARPMGAAPLLAALLATLQPAIAHAQDTRGSDGGKVVISGTVVDRSTGVPMSGVFVAIESLNLTVFSDREGRFATRAITTGTWTLTAGQLGFKLWRQDWVVAPGMAAIEIRMEPDPIMLEGIQVVSDGIKRRRNATAVSVRAYSADQLTFGASFDARQFISTRLMVARCPSSAWGTDCVWRRGSMIEPRVYIDEIPLIGGFDFLGLYNTSELYLIEIYDSGSQIRVYTKAFAERLAMGRERLWPVIY